MHGWLVVNHFTKWQKFEEIFEILEKSAFQNDIVLERKTNATLLADLGGNTDYRPDFVLFWDKDVRLARFLESTGLRLYNPASAIESCDDKSLTHIALSGSGISMPRTIIAPKTFNPEGYADLCFLDEVAARLGFPVVVKECFGSFGQQVHMAEDMATLQALTQEISPRPLLYQSFVKSSHGRDVRLQVVGNSVIAAMYRYSQTGDFRANVTNGASIKGYDPTDSQKKVALLACKELKLDFAGVDLLFGENDEPVLCEVNSNAHFKNIQDCTGVNTADAIMKHIQRTCGA